MAATNKKNTISFFNSHLISVVSISLVLFLLGLILIIGFIGNELSRYVKENITLSVVLDEDLTGAQIRQLREQLEKQPFVKSTEYISKEQASLEMQRELGEDPTTFLGFNPFHASVEIKLKSEYTDPDSLALVEKRIASKANISSINYPKDMMRMVNQNIRRISFVLMILFILLIVISFVLISNTVKLLIYSKRFIIYTMRLVGANASFIRRPFLRHNVLCGLIAGFLAIIMLMISLFYLRQELNIDDILSRDIMLLVYLTILVAGVLLSVIAAYFAVNRYLRMARGKLYYV